MSAYPKKDFPWTFYFNGLEMPKWGACWPQFPENNHQHWDWEVGPRDFYIIRNKIDRVGSVESANPHVFIYAIQEFLCLVLTERKWALDHCRKLAAEPVTAQEIYNSLINTAVEMRDRARKEGHAFWVSGYEADRARLVEAMRRANLPPNDPAYVPPPHMQARQNHLKLLWQTQIKTLRQAASGNHISAALRKKLLEF